MAKAAAQAQAGVAAMPMKGVAVAAASDVCHSRSWPLTLELGQNQFTLMITVPPAMAPMVRILNMRFPCQPHPCLPLHQFVPRGICTSIPANPFLVSRNQIMTWLRIVCKISDGLIPNKGCSATQASHGNSSNMALVQLQGRPVNATNFGPYGSPAAAAPWRPSPSLHSASSPANTASAPANSSIVYSLSVVQLADPEHAEMTQLNATTSTKAWLLACCSVSCLQYTALHRFEIAMCFFVLYCITLELSKW